MEDFEPLVAEEHKFENGAKKMQYSLEILDCQDTDAKNINGQFSDRKPLYTYNLFNADPDRRDKTCSVGEM